MERQLPTTIPSRKNSLGSCHSIPASSASSNQNSDDDDSDTTSQVVSYKERRREAHTQAEQKRRDAIRRGYDELQTLVCPPVNDPTGLKQTKVSKATVLQKSISQIEKLLKQKENQLKELERLKKEVMALKIMKANYEHILKANQNAGQVSELQLPTELKFQVFQQMMDQLFLSFNAYTSTSTFAELSACVISWLEEHCKPQCLRELMHKTMSVALSQYQQQRDHQRKSAVSVAQQQHQQQQQLAAAVISATTLAQANTAVLPSSLLSAARIPTTSSETVRAPLMQHLPQLVHHLTAMADSNSSQAAVGQQHDSDSKPVCQQAQATQTILGTVVAAPNPSASANPFTL